MSRASERIRCYREAKWQLTNINKNRKNVVVIHYSCESFYDRPDGTSPRITSIAVWNLSTSQTESFSIHQIAERNQISIEEIETHYDALETEMLKEFYDYVEKHKNYDWVHWNMRNINYGFAALEHRYKVLGGNPNEIHEFRRHDLSQLLFGLLGADYVEHPRMKSLVIMNSISDLNFLSGADEAKAFEDREYVKLHLSTLRKVNIISDIFDRAIGGTLRTQAKRKSIYGNYFVYYVERARENWFFVLFGILGTIASIFSVIWCR